jgi:acyl-CoA synthetase (AMP-forming)/AMP-acid ligase II
MPSPGPAKVEVLHASDAEVRQRRAAAALLARGCTQGDRVAFALGSSADLICSVLGAARVGLIPVLLNATLTPVERDALADDAEPAVRVFEEGALVALTSGDDTSRRPEQAGRPAGSRVAARAGSSTTSSG